MYSSKYPLVLTFLFCSICVFAQNPDLLGAQGEIPKDFITSSSIKFKKQLKDLEGKSTKRRDRKNKKRFLLESNFAIDDVLQSGLVLFNDPASIYVNKVLDNLPFSSQNLKAKKPRAYILNTPAVNAFATDQGIIFVTLGLLANLENEAQLAFILAHELIHIEHQHALNKFEQSKSVDRSDRRNRRRMNDVSVDRNMFKKSMYSRKLEEQADDEGFEIFMASDYDPQMVLNTFKILHYSYLPFDDIPFDKSFFEDEHFVFPDYLWLTEVNPISAMDVDRETEKSSSHPSSTKRLKKMEKLIVGKTFKNKKAFLLPEKEFRSIQKKARYQIPFLNLYSENFPDAIYTAYLLLKDNPTDIELKKVIGKSLYMMAKYQNYDSVLRDDMKEIRAESEGEMHQIYNFSITLSAKELTILATKYNWNLLKQAKEDAALKTTVEDLFIELAIEFDNLDDFSNTTNTSIVFDKKDNSKKIVSDEKQDAEIMVEIEVESGAEVSEEKEEKLEAEEETEKNYFWKYAFVEEKKNEQFAIYFDDGHKTAQKRKDRDEYYDTIDGIRAYRKRLIREEKKGKKLGIDKVVVVNPFYLSIDSRKNDAVQFIRSEEKQIAFRKAIDKVAKISSVDTEVLDVTALSSSNIEVFNEISEINNYFSQQMDFYDLSLTPSYNQNITNQIANKYGTDYFLWTGVISIREKNNGWKYTALSLLYPYLLPLTLQNTFTPEFDMLYYAILFDVKTGRRSILKMDYFDARDSKTILSAHIYDVFHQIGSEGKR